MRKSREIARKAELRSVLVALQRHVRALHCWERAQSLHE
jgi:hypothetical protein